jgi:hypothetical protein
VDLALEDVDLVSKDQDPEVLVGVTMPHADDQLKKPAQAHADKGEQQDPRSWHQDGDRYQPAVMRTGW